MARDPVAIFRRFLFVRETEGANKGAWVEFFQHFCDGVPGDSWCADIESVVEYITFGKCLSPKTGSVQVKLDFMVKHGWEIQSPEYGCVIISVDANRHGHHIALCTLTMPGLQAIAGNTSEDGSSDNGTGCFEHIINTPRSNLRFFRFPTN